MRRLARVDGVRLVGHLLLEVPPNAHLPRRRVAGPRAEPAAEPFRLGDRGPHVVDRGGERAGEDQVALSLAGLGSSGDDHALSPALVGAAWVRRSPDRSVRSRTVRRTSRSRASSWCTATGGLASWSAAALSASVSAVVQLVTCASGPGTS